MPPLSCLSFLNKMVRRVSGAPLGPPAKTVLSQNRWWLLLLSVVSVATWVTLRVRSGLELGSGGCGFLWTLD